MLTTLLVHLIYELPLCKSPYTPGHRSHPMQVDSISISLLSLMDVKGISLKDLLILRVLSFIFSKSDVKVTFKICFWDIEGSYERGSCSRM